LSRDKSKYFFSSSKVELDLPRSHIYVSICSVKERTTMIKSVSSALPMSKIMKSVGT
jgi:hypothetical protein